ncbi:hypothetical protein BDZ94DRAFT_1276065 [Collybia nuda]|uniref:Uncharacterized protein n=1 Tax=Collybia nuda TaxID=64659 RepID=A0A9P5XRL1_9AGAR|nr:hypothetical protein BDZ94DRAFT_1276065 [Collybia nuda]
MQFNVALLAAALVVSASPALSATVVFFSGADCTGQNIGQRTDLGPNVCLTLGSRSARSIRYSGIPNNIRFYESGGGHDSCTNGATTTLGGGSGCSTAPAGFNWESVSYN